MPVIFAAAPGSEAATPGPASVSLFSTLIIAVVISMILYRLIGKSPQPQVERRRRAPAPTATPRRTTQTQGQTRLPPMSEEAKTLLKALATLPNHVDPNSLSKSGAGIGGTHILIDGLVAYRHGYGVGADSAELRKDRARLLSGLLSLDESPSPPTKGSTMVVSVPREDMECKKLHRILYLLATYYNVIVVVTSDGPEDAASKLERAVTDAAGGVDKPPLPSHRVLKASHATGIIAMVRQLQRVSLVIASSSSMDNGAVAAAVQSELSRFGFRVIVVPPPIHRGVNGASSLASCLSDN